LRENPALQKKASNRLRLNNYGGPLVIGSGLFLLRQTDKKFKAFNNNTGKLLWERNLAAPGYATPSTYAVDVKQYIVIAAWWRKIAEQV
jgi:quinoprotein glucose dehydrogenase